jgi:ribosomal protein L29
MKIAKLKSKSLKELKVEWEQRIAKLHAYELDLKSGKEKDTSKVKGLRHDVARILTLLTQKQGIAEVKLDSVPVEEKVDKDK